MQSTMDLLAEALKIKSQAAWCRQLAITPGAISQARKRGTLSPTLAGNIALEIGEDPEKWVAVAAMESEKENALSLRLKKKTGKWSKPLEKPKRAMKYQKTLDLVVT